ncbi:MAG: hypothetical protein KGJ37_02475, partial [Verrucomicrobiota bacterium]|nr:hypothetical protein [Verrucomicrobiota bacterium]
YAQYILAVTLSAGATGALVASVSPPRIHPFTLEIERDVYPVEAIAFMRDHRLTGKTITFFDWGQQVLWELPNNPVSFDGRLDTVYPPSVMEAHWRFYRGENPGPGFDPAQAEVALLPTGSGATTRLLGMGWIEVYQDPLASVLVKNRAQFAGLANLSLPFRRGLDAVRGREPFPAALPALAAPHAPR